jgi:MFS transporter, BCD family, chlorophyll transporter
VKFRVHQEGIMHIFRSIRLGMLHIAVAITFVLINGVLNRVMIAELGIPATLVALLTVLPYLLTPLQVWLGRHSDTHPFFGYRRTPYIAIGVLMCIGGALLTPHAALLGAPLLLGIAFGLWGFGYNLAVVGYLSLASDLSDETRRARTIAIMWFMMIASIIVTAIVTSRALDPYSPQQLVSVFNRAGGIALLLAVLGLVGLEPRIAAADIPASGARHSSSDAIRAVIANPQARLFFLYLVLLLAAILGQDVLLEPFGAQAFGMSVSATTQLTATWGGATLAALLLYGLVLSRWLGKHGGAWLGGVLATVGLLGIACSGAIGAQALFVPAIAVLGFGTGISTSANLGLMLDMTTAEQVGLYIGAWPMRWRAGWVRCWPAASAISSWGSAAPRRSPTRWYSSSRPGCSARRWCSSAGSMFRPSVPMI